MDGVTFPTRIEGIESLTVTADSEVMQNYQSALPVAANQTLAAVEDSTGNPMVFSIGGDGHLYLLMADPGGPTGWKQLDLTASVSRWGLPASFAVGQVPGGNITLAVAVSPPSGAPVIVVAGPLSNDARQTDWTRLADYWVAVGNPQPSATLQALYLGPVDASGGYGLPLLAVGFSGGAPGTPNDYLFQPGVTATGVSWKGFPFPTPTDSSVIQDYAMGAVSGLGTGVYILYENTLAQSQLVFQTLPDSYGRHYARELTAPPGATCLEATASGGTTDLYVGGSSGVFLFSHTSQTDRASGVGIASSQDVPGIREGGLIVRQDSGSGGTAAIWALGGEDLMYFHGSATEPGGYSKPVVFEAGVARVAAIRSQTKKANQLVFMKTDVRSNPSIVWMWQDPQSSLWQRDLIPLQDTGNTQQFNCYTTTLTFTDPRAQARPGLEVKVSASGWTRVVINGVSHLLDQDTAVTATTDLTGNLTLINPISDLATPRFVVTAANPADFDGALLIEPAFKVYSRLKQVRSAGDIPDSVLAKLPSGVTKDQVADAISRLMAYQPDPAPQGAAIVYQAGTPTAKLAVARPAISVPAAHKPWTLSFGAPRAKTLQLSVAGEVWDGVTNLAGDLWQFATSVIDQVVSITVDVIQDALTFVVNLVGKTVHIVIKTLEDVFKAISFILQKVAAVIEDVIRWLGFLFNWKDMWDCHLVMANFVNSSLTYVVGRLDAEADVLKAGISAAFAQLKTSIHKLVLPDEVANADLQSQQQAATQSNPQASMNSAPANWTLYQVQHGGVSSGTADDTGPTPGNPLVQFFQDIVVPTVEVLKTDIEKLFRDIGALFQGRPTVNDFLVLVNDFIDTFLDAVEKLILGFIDFATDLLADLQALLTAALDIPFFSNLYRFVTKLLGTEEELTVVNVLSLAAAIPVTILYKLVTNRELFPGGTSALLQPDIFAQMMGSGPLMAQKSLVLATTTGGPDWSSPAFIYSHVIGLAPAILLPVASVLGIFVLNRQVQLEVPTEDSPLTGEGRKKLGSSLRFLSMGVLGCKVLALATSFPLPKKQSPTSDVLSILNWFLSGWRLVGMLLIEPLYTKLSPSPTAGRTAKFINSGHDAICALVQGAIYMVTDSLDLAAVKDQLGELDSDDFSNAVAGWTFTYCQDLANVGGSILTDIGNAASIVPSATVKTVSLVSRVAGTTLTLGSSLLLLFRIGLSVDSKLDNVVRVHLSS